MKLSIRAVAQLLGVNPQTLRRWDNKKTLKSERQGPSGHRYYTEDAIEDFLSGSFKYLLNLAQRWIGHVHGFALPPRLYCADRSVFKARLSKLETFLMKDPAVGDSYSLITSIVGEIGNNSFDHNLGNWPDLPGIFFGYVLSERKIILADRGQGILTTLRRIRPELANDQAALKTAFTEIVSGRAPESRGNGLKYVKKVVENNAMKLFFQSGDALLKISLKAQGLNIASADKSMRGCLAVIEY